MLKVGFCFRLDAKDHRGGDVVQMEKIINSARKLELFDGEIVCDIGRDWSSFDVINFTNLDRPVDFYLFFESIRRSKFDGGMVLSSIHHSYSEIENFEKKGRRALFSYFLGRLGFARLEIMRSVVRSIRYPSLLWATIYVAFKGVPNIQRLLLNNVKNVFVLSNKEVRDICCDLGVDKSSISFKIIRNAFPEKSKTNNKLNSKNRSGIVCIGRIEPRKNQISIINALSGIGQKVYFIGALNKNNPSYCRKFIDRVNSSCGEFNYLGAKTSDEVKRILENSICHVSASWFEVASLVDLEASSCGAWVVSSKCGSTSEVISERISIIDPENLISIRSAVVDAIKYNEQVGFHYDSVMERSWDDVALEYFSAYKDVIKF